MNMNRRKLSFIIIFTIILTTMFVPVVNASNYVDLWYDDYDFYDTPTDENPRRPIQNSELTHSSGNHISAYVGATGDLYVDIVASDGSIEVNLQLEVFTVSGKLWGVRVSEHDNNTVLVYVVDGRERGTFDYLTATVYEFDMTTFNYVWDELTSILQPASSTITHKYAMTSENHVVDEKSYWCTLTYEDDASGTDYLDYFVINYNVDSNILTLDKQQKGWLAVTTLYQPPTLISYTDDVFLLHVFTGATATPALYSYTISTDTMTLLATATSSNKMEYNDKYQIYSNTIETNSTDIFVDLLYGISDNLGYQPQFEVILLRYKFNISVTQPTYLQMDIASVGISIYSYPTDPNNPWTLGVAKEGDITQNEFYVWYAEYDYFQSGTYYYKLKKMTFTINDIYDLGDSIVLGSNEDDLETEIIILTNTAKCYKELTSRFQTIIVSDVEEYRLYYDLAPAIDDFEMSTSYIPDETPLTVGDIYTFTYYVTNGDIPYQGGIMLIYVDGTLIESTVTDFNGEVIKNILFSSIGQHNITIKMYKHMLASTYSINEDFIYYVVSSGEVDVGDYDEDDISLFGTNLMTVAMEMLPVVIMVMFPAFYLGKVGGITGFFGGMIIGTAIGIRTSLIPVAYGYLIALVIVMGVVMAIRSGGMSTGGNTT